MKIVTEIFRWFTGLLFIFSGLIKVNDPVGTSIKLTEYFDVFSQDTGIPFTALSEFSVLIAIILVVLEVVLGVALLVKFKPTLTLSALLGLIVFFTFLTFYSAFFNKVTDCGCFGDAIKLTPWESFYKDIVLLVMILWLFAFRRKLKTPDNQASRMLAVMLVFLLSTAFAYYAFAHLPFIDFLPYKVGSHIPTSMQPSAPFEYEYIMLKDGKEVAYREYPMDESYEFKEMRLLNPEAQPKINDYNIWRGDQDFTEFTLTGKKLLIIITKSNKANRKVFTRVQGIQNTLSSLGIEPIVLTSSEPSSIDAFMKSVGINYPYFFGDATVLKTMVRSNPGFLFLENGTIRGKFHFNDLPGADDVRSLYAQ
jgi:uncharacterized membrane protein YphA (DoxX/SURF4 family)